MGPTGRRGAVARSVVIVVEGNAGDRLGTRKAWALPCWTTSWPGGEVDGDAERVHVVGCEADATSVVASQKRWTPTTVTRDGTSRR